MRSFPIFLLLFAFSYHLQACAQKTSPSTSKTLKAKTKAKAKKPTKQATAPVTQPLDAKAQNETGPVLTFERTPCFGTCPAYSMKVYANGRVAYDGRRAVPLMGPRELKITPAALAKMLSKAQEVHFEQFQDRYSQNTSDLPSTVIGIRQPNGQVKTVVVEEGAPENVLQLVNYLAQEFDALANLRADK